MRTVKVSAGGNIVLKPDITVVSISMSGKADDYARARHDAENALSQVQELLPQLGFAPEDLKSTDYGISPELDFTSQILPPFGGRPDFSERPPVPRREPAGQFGEGPVFRQQEPRTTYRFHHDMSLAFPIDHERLGKILSVLSEGLVGPDLWFYYTVEDEKKAKNEALGRLIAEAEMRARCLAEAAGAELKEVQTIEHTAGESMLRTNRISAANYRNLSAGGGPDGTTVLMAGELVFRDTVTAVWEIG